MSTSSSCLSNVGDFVSSEVSNEWFDAAKSKDMHQINDDAFF